MKLSSINTAYAINFPRMTTPKLSRIGVIDFCRKLGRFIPCTIYLSINNVQINHWPFSESPSPKKDSSNKPNPRALFRNANGIYISFCTRACRLRCSLRFRPIVKRANQRNVETNVRYNIIGRVNVQ